MLWKFCGKVQFPMYDHATHREDNIFAVVVYRLSVRKKCLSAILEIALKLMVNKGF